MTLDGSFQNAKVRYKKKKTEGRRAQRKGPESVARRSGDRRAERAVDRKREKRGGGESGGKSFFLIRYYYIDSLLLHYFGQR